MARAKRRNWTKAEVARLYHYAETVSQIEAARRLDRSFHSVAGKARDLGIVWRQGMASYRSIAAEVGCSATTVRRLAKILCPDGVPCTKGHNGRRMLIGWELHKRLVKVLLGTRKRRQHHVRGGKKRWEKSVDLAPAPG